MILPMLLMMALPAAAEPFVDFDAGRSNVQVVSAEAKAQAGKLLARVPLAPHVNEGTACSASKAVEPGPVDLAVRPAAFCSASADCVDFILDPQDKQTEYFPLRYTDQAEVCRYGPRGERDCYCEMRWTTNARVQIRIPERKTPFPWERERFRMCLERNYVDYYEIATAFEYDAKFIENTAVVVATPKGKIPMNPDKDGINLESFASDAAANNYTLVLADKWASYYKGEQTVLKLKLRKKVFLGASTIFETELRLAPADRYTVRFADYASKFSSPLEDGGKYFVEWKFQRSGAISKDKTVDKDDSAAIEFHKSSAASSR